MPSKEVRVEKGLGKRLQDMLRPIAIIQKKDRFGLGYKLDKRGRQRYMEEKREKRIASFLGKKEENAGMEIPSLSHTFRSVGFIIPEVIQGDDREISVDEAFESLSIDIVEVGDQEASNTRLPPFPRGQMLDNWTIVELPVVFKLSNE